MNDHVKIWGGCSDLPWILVRYLRTIHGLQWLKPFSKDYIIIWFTPHYTTIFLQDGRNPNSQGKSWFRRLGIKLCDIKRFLWEKLDVSSGTSESWCSLAQSSAINQCPRSRLKPMANVFLPSNILDQIKHTDYHQPASDLSSVLIEVKDKDNFQILVHV